MNVEEAYSIWATQYDTNKNRTRDLEAIAFREILQGFKFDHCLEIGCGTGKNTEWLLTKAKEILAIDITEAMLAKARQKIKSETVQFIQADITRPWTFATKLFDLIVFSLVLEHIENIDTIFKEASKCLKKGGYIYLGELHPFKQYAGTKARFETENGIEIVPCFNHHVSDFTENAKKYGFEISSIQEFFDENDRNNIPRILAIVFKKP